VIRRYKLRLDSTEIIQRKKWFTSTWKIRITFTILEGRKKGETLRFWYSLDSEIGRMLLMRFFEAAGVPIYAEEVRFDKTINGLNNKRPRLKFWGRIKYAGPQNEYYIIRELKRIGK